MPFGLNYAPSVFQRAVHLLFNKLRFDQIIIYLDDIPIAAETKSENIAILENVLIILSKGNLTLNLSKCRFVQEQNQFPRS